MRTIRAAANWIETTPAARIAGEILLDAFMTLLWAGVLLAVYSFLRRTEQQFGGGSINFIAPFFAFGLMLSLGWVFDKIIDLALPKKKRPGDVTGLPPG